MALTKHDLEQISNMFSKQFTVAYDELFSPHFDHMYKKFEEIDEKFDEIDERFERIDNKLEKLEDKLDTHVVTTSERFDEVFQLIGYYFEGCVKNEDHVKLENRVLRLETINA